ncbi:Histidine kinase-like ATPase domain-containing protein [Parafrankia irregularis]|uniref:Histidine kinase-like ATPase domain-containing protein n=1 Tax=Parafrankia irregularis TaxID=795642 RepID=A0A0S4R129_9ACTN|nr:MULTISPECIES: ATP-binding protein [Frankiaceae]MBE3204764.1 recombinase family protein [Parafrankia sp. CH37]CUU60908.1 Histidine kinase-like ATPase domain-containing protein [Parafrankia irregularis]
MRAFGYVRVSSARDDELHRLRDMIRSYAAAEGMSLVAIYVDQEGRSTDAARPGLTTLLEAVGRSDRAVMLVPDMTHLPCAQHARRFLEEEVTALGSAIVPLASPSRVPTQAAPTDQQHQPGSRGVGRNPTASPTIRVTVERFPALLSSVPAARAAALRTLQGWRLTAETLNTAELIVSELTANAAKASPADGIVAVRLTASGSSLLIEVWDSTVAPPVLRDPAYDGEDGRGLFLVNALSRRWSWRRAKSGGKVVWAEMPADTMDLQDDGSAVQLIQRTAGPVPDPVRPVAFEHDPALLRRVADGLRALDDWYLPGTEAARSGKPPLAAEDRIVLPASITTNLRTEVCWTLLAEQTA